MKIDGETLYKWWEETWPKDVRRGTWDRISEQGQAGWNALADRIKAEMERPFVIEEGAIQVNFEGWCKPGEVVELPLPMQRVPGALRNKVYDASKEWWLTQPGFATPANDGEAEKIRQLSKATFKSAIENTILACPPTFDPKYSERILEQAIEEGKMPGQTKVAKATSNEYSTHHKSCALRHDRITCTCP